MRVHIIKSHPHLDNMYTFTITSFCLKFEKVFTQYKVNGP